MQEEKMLTPLEAAKYLGVSPKTLYRRLKEKGVKPTNFNPMFKRQPDPRYSKAELDKLKDAFLYAA